MDDLISIIIPVYNVKQYIERCLDSVLHQTYRMIEVILVDDRSTDGSADICSRYAQSDNRIRLISHQVNGGPSKARNVGMELARGRFITFIDADDFVSEKYIADLYSVMIHSDADVAMCGYKRIINESDICQENIEIEKTTVFSGIQALEAMLYRKQISSYVWGKLYKTDILKNSKFPEGKIFEDLRILSDIFPNAGYVAYNSVTDYFYFQRNGSLIHQEYHDSMFDQVVASQEILQAIEHVYPQIINAAISKVFISSVDVYRKIPAYSCYEVEKKILQKNIKNYRKRVLMDKKNKRIVRMIALVACFSIRVLRLCCIVAGKFKLRFMQKSV